MVKLTAQEQEFQEQGRLVKEIMACRGWDKVIVPLLENQIKASLVDPRKFKTDDEYLYAQKVAWAYGQYASDLLGQLEKMVEESEMITKKEKGEIKDKLREAVS